MIFRNDLLQQVFTGLDLLRRRRRGRIDDRRPEHLAGRIHHSQLTAGSEGRIPAQHHPSCDGRLHEELVQVLSEYFDGAVLRFLRQFAADLTLNGRSDQPTVAVLHRFLQDRSCVRIILMDRLLLQIAQDIFLGRFHLHRQELLLLTPVQRQDPVPRQLRYRLLELVIHLINGFRLRVFRRGSYFSFFHRRFPDPGPVIRIVRDHFRDNIHGAGNRVRRALYALLLRNVLRRRLLQRLFRILQQDVCGQRLQPFLFGDGRPGPTLRAVRPVEVLHRHQRLRRQDLRFQFFRQFALLVDAGDHLLFLLFQIPQIFQALVQLPQLLVIEGARDLLPVSGNERDRISLVYKIHRCVDLPALYVQFFG